MEISTKILLEITKAIKTEEILFGPYYAYSCSNEFHPIIIAKYELVGGEVMFENIIFNRGLLVNFLKTIDQSIKSVHFIITDLGTYLVSDCDIESALALQSYKPYLPHHVNDSAVFNMVKQKSVLYMNTDLKLDPAFLNIINGKSSDGISIYTPKCENNDMQSDANCNLGMYSMTIMSSLLPINKDDKVCMTIFKNDSISFITEFLIRKKAIEIRVLFRYGILSYNV